MVRLLLAFAFAFALPAVAQEPPADPFAKWTKEIDAIEKRLKEKPPEKGGVFFAGSSSIRLWDLKKSFPDLPVVNVGFGGSIIRDTTHFADRILLPYEPKTIVFYAGDNDLGAKRSPEQVRDDFREFVKTVRAKLPKTAILFVAVKPSPKRWAIYDQQQKANALVKAECEAGENLKYVDVVGPMLGKDGMPMADIFKDDNLHMNEKGYAIWTSILMPLLK
jgi:lysophospholipase L1-like esterase